MGRYYGENRPHNNNLPYTIIPIPLLFSCGGPETGPPHENRGGMGLMVYGRLLWGVMGTHRTPRENGDPLCGLSFVFLLFCVCSIYLLHFVFSCIGFTLQTLYQKGGCKHNLNDGTMVVCFVCVERPQITHHGSAPWSRFSPTHSASGGSRRE